MHPAPAIAAGLMMLTLAGTVAVGQPEQPGVNPRTAAQVDRLMANDANADGFLARDELPERLAERIFDSADTDADGRLSRAELEAYFDAQRGRGARGAPGQAEDGAAPAPATPAGAVSDEAFEGAMKQAGMAMRTLRRTGFEPATRDSDLDALQSIQEAMVLAKATFTTVPVAPQAKAKYQGDEEAYRRDFRMAIVGSLRAALDIEAALLGDDIQAAKDALVRLLDNQKSSHNLFQDNG